MYKFYVVGLGGSGGKTLQFVMDQLSGELRQLGWEHDRLPSCWQFVHVDVPPQSDGVGQGLPPTVRAQGGGYVAVTNSGDHYKLLDAGLEQTLMNKSGTLRQLARWRPEAVRVGAPITQGAGQYRAVGRLATLARAQKIFEGLRPPAERLNQAASNTDLTEVAELLRLGTGPAQNTLVLVVSSLAGGTGASMTLDICNLLRAVEGQVPNFPGRQSIAFLYTPDVFRSLNAADRAGVNANALGTVSELMSAMAATDRPWTADEWSVYGGLDLPATATGRGPAAVFPVGASNGVSGAIFGDGRPETIYRGMARAISSLMLSETQQTQLAAYAIGNIQNRAPNTDHSELTVQADGQTTSVGFDAMGFASIGLGRDRYAEYAAQRLARAAVDHLRSGHIDVSVHQGQRTPDQARLQYANDYFPLFVRRVGLPVVTGPQDGDGLKALIAAVWSADEQQAVYSAAAEETSRPLRTPGMKVRANQVAAHVQGVVATLLDRVRGDSETSARTAATRWAPQVQTRIELATLWLIGQRGLPVTEQVLERFGRELQLWAGTLQQHSANPVTVQASVASVSEGLQTVSGDITPQHGIIAQITQKIRGTAERVGMIQGGALTASLLLDLVPEVVRPLRQAVTGCIAELDLATADQAGGSGPASVRTDSYQQWPHDDVVPGRFATATNEVLLEDQAGYPQRLAAHLAASFITRSSTTGQPPSVAQSEGLAVGEVLTWLRDNEQGQQASVRGLPGGESGDSPTRVGRRIEWWPRTLMTVSPARTAAYELPLTHTDVLEAARSWVDRADEPVGRFVREGLRDYLADRSLGSQHEMDRRATAFSSKFREALQLAAPLVAVDRAMVQAVHGQSVLITYRFSEVPLAGSAAVGHITQAMQAEESISAVSVQNFQQALSAADRSRVDLIGTYVSPYSPLVYSSLLQPIKQQWTQCAAVGDRLAFWQWRRGRPMADFVPVSPQWYQALITGVLIGRLTGDFLLPGEGPAGTRLVAWDDRTQTWETFPNPLLGVRDLAADTRGWGTISVLVESLALAVALADGDPGFTSLRGYRALRGLGADLQIEQFAVNPSLYRWLQTGVGCSGQPPRGRSESQTAEERRNAAISWLEGVARSMSEELPQGHPEGGGNGSFATVTPLNFKAVPREWELAEQLTVAARQIRRELDKPEYLNRDEPAPSVLGEYEF